MCGDVGICEVGGSLGSFRDVGLVGLVDPVVGIVKVQKNGELLVADVNSQ